jgi:hypothetical protein
MFYQIIDKIYNKTINQKNQSINHTTFCSFSKHANQGYTYMSSHV